MDRAAHLMSGIVGDLSFSFHAPERPNGDDEKRYAIPQLVYSPVMVSQGSGGPHSSLSQL